MGQDGKQDSQAWKPPTPDSIFVAPVAPLPDDDELERDDAFQLQPALVDSIVTKQVASHVVDNTDERMTPAHVLVAGAPIMSREPVLGLFSSQLERRASKISGTGQLEEIGPDDFLPPARKRPRREASAKALAMKQPSPFDLSGDEHVPSPTASEDELEDDSDSRARRRSSGKGSAKEGRSSRRISHSLIERRRREKINDCLETLRIKVPQCKELVQRKEAKAKERNRRQHKPGLHKLEILQGTVEYIEELEVRLAKLQAAQIQPPVPSRHYDVPIVGRPSFSSSSSASSATSASLLTPTLVQEMRPVTPLLVGAEEDLAARALLTISTSPELRPVS